MSAELQALAAKYREMITLRRDTGAKDGARLKALAASFPGALRELDTRTMASLEERLAELERGACPAWATIQSRFHGWMRVALRMREEGVSDLDSARAWSASYEPRDPGDPQRAELDDARLLLLARPPNGRISLAVRSVLGVDPDELDALLFGAR